MSWITRTSAYYTNVVCTEVNKKNQREQCKFVKTTPDCVDNMYFVQYLAFYYCNFDTNNKFSTFFAMMLLAILCAYMFWMMRIATEDYFCPTLKVISDSFSLNENAAGVTILAMANGSPDIFTGMAGMMNKAKYGYLSSLSQLMFLNMFIGGMVMLTRPFYAQPSYFMRDWGFLFLNTVLLDFVHKRKPQITRYEAVAVASIYIIYIIVALMDQRLLMLRIKQLEKKERERAAAMELWLQEEEGEEEEEGSEDTHRTLKGLQSMAGLPIKKRRSTSSSIPHYPARNSHLFRQFINSVYRLNKKAFKHGNYCVKLHMIVRLPLDIALRILIPVVDLEQPNYGWSKLLCCLQFALAPTYITFILLRKVTVFGIGLFLLAFYILVPLGCLIFIRTRTDTAPPFFRHMAFLGFIGSIFVIFAVSSEVMAMFFTLGTIWNISQPLILATVVCWSMNCNDLVACVSLARQGFPRMAYAACFASPVFGTFVGLALPLVFESFLSSKGVAIPIEGSFGETTGIIALIGLSSTLLTALTTHFMMRRACGALNVIVYLFYLVMLILLEYDVIHSYGVEFD